MTSTQDKTYQTLVAYAEYLKTGKRNRSQLELRTLKGELQIKFREMGELPKHLDRAIIAAETWSERDQVCRRLSSNCYNQSQRLLKEGRSEDARKWMALSLQYMQLSMGPKEKQMEVDVDADLAELKSLIDEAKKRQKEEAENEAAVKSRSLDAKP